MAFARILRASALMGGAQVVILAAAFVRAKAIAIILGASGVGLIGIFNAFSGNVSSFAGWGLGTSGVRLIAGAPEEEKPAKVAAVRWMGWTLSLLGLALALILFWPVGSVTFASSQYAIEMAIVACAVPCVIASLTWSAILQAAGKIASLAKVQISGALTGLLLGLPAIYFWGTIGIAISIFLAAAVPAFVLWRAARAECQVSAGFSAQSEDLGRLVKLGGALMLVGWLGQLSAYLVRLAIVRQEGLDAAGYYQAAFAISGSLPGFVFAAMGADFFPRVAGAQNDSVAVKVVERQIQAGLLLSVPFIAVMIMFKAECVRLLYSPGLDPSAQLVPWMSWAVYTRIISWPMGFWLIARGAPTVVMVIESSASLLTVIASTVLLALSGTIGASIGTLAAAAAYLTTLVLLLRFKSGARFSTLTWQAVAASAILLGAAQCLSLAEAPNWVRMTFGAFLTGLSVWGYFKVTHSPAIHDDET